MEQGEPKKEKKTTEFIGLGLLETFITCQGIFWQEKYNRNLLNVA
jgi:hypothetical protein